VKDSPSTSSGRTDEGAKPKSGSGWLNVAVDYGPLIVFLSFYFYNAPGDDSPDQTAMTILAVMKATGAFIVAAVAAVIVSYLVGGKVSKMLLLSTLLIVVFGGWTLYTGNEFYLQIKPTILYALFAAILLGGWLKGKAFLKWLLEAGFEGLSDEGWMKLSRNWGFFFVFLALLNEVLRYFFNVDNGNFDVWASSKIWVFMPLTFLFTFTQIPMLLKHGLAVDEQDDVLKNEPPTG
jgi:intracellular septation protein